MRRVLMGVLTRRLLQPRQVGFDDTPRSLDATVTPAAQASE